MAFGEPEKSFALWMGDKVPDAKTNPYYRTSTNLPAALLNRIDSRRSNMEYIHSLTLGKDQSFILSFKPLGDPTDVLWHLAKDYERLDRILLGTRTHHNIRGSLGADGEFWLRSDQTFHTPVTNNIDLIDEVEEMPHGDVVNIAFGIGGSGIILDKDGTICSHGSTVLRSNYPTYMLDIDTHSENMANVSSITLNPFHKDEYFIAFKDGSFCYKSAALGGHYDETCHYHPSYKGTDPGAANPPNPVPNDTKLKHRFDNLMRAWKIGKAWEGHTTSDADDVWITPKVLEPPKMRKSVNNSGEHGVWTRKKSK